MALADYAHWNEEAPRIWWEEEGKHYDSDAESSYYERYEVEDDYDFEADAFEDELYQLSDEELGLLIAKLRVEDPKAMGWKYDMAANEQLRREWEAGSCASS